MFPRAFHVAVMSPISKTARQSAAGFGARPNLSAFRRIRSSFDFEMHD